MSTRDTVLDAFEQILIESGERAATMDAVAAAAHISKGGLLYHFKSKDALVDGLLTRLSELSNADLEEMAAAPQGPAAYYIGTSTYLGSALDRALVAATRLQDGNPAVRHTMRLIQDAWYQLILQEVGDAATARAVQLIGDGLYYNAALADTGSDNNTRTDVGPGAQHDDVTALLEVVEFLKTRPTT